jgi:hypothetical protein
MTTWTDIFPDVDGPPVVGLPAQFTTVSRSFAKMHDDAVQILDQFKRIIGEGDFDEIQGEVAGPLRTFVEHVSDRLQSLPDVSQDASTIFADHSSKLDDYRTAADKALAKAITKWNERKTAAGQLDTANSSEAKAKQNVDNQPPDADPSSTTQAKDQHDQAVQHVTDLKGKLSTIDGELKAFRTKWDDLHGDEKELRDHTKGRLDDIDLHSLEDPGWFDSFCEAVGDVLRWAYKVTGLEDLVELIEAIATGDWAAILWRLRDLLDKVFVILSVVALIVCPFALLAVIAVIAVAKLAIDAGLYLSNTADPKTGRRISAMDLAFDVFDAATAGRASQLHEAAALTRATDMADGAVRYAQKSGRSAALRGTINGSTAYTKGGADSQIKLLDKAFGLTSTETIYTRGTKSALHTVTPNITPKFVIRTTQDLVVKPTAVVGYAGLQAQEATKGPEVEQLEQSMDTDRPFFSPISEPRAVDIIAEFHR